MNDEFRLTRHSNLWEEQDKRIKHTVIATLIFSILLLMNVLKPYSADLDIRQEIETEIKKFQDEKTRIEASIAQTDDFKKNATAIQTLIRKQPWMQKKDELIQTLAEINNRGEGGWTRYQKEADNTIRAIGNQVNELVALPLDTLLDRDPLVAEEMPELYAQVKALPSAIEQWVTSNLGKRWYRTLDAKRARVELLTRGLETQLSDISTIINAEKPKLFNKRRELTRQIETLEQESDIEAKEELFKVLEARMEKIMPEWIRGLITVQQMIQFYPLIIVGLVIYVLFLTIPLNSHYRAMTELRKISGADKTDPIFSSLWTLTYRGYPGTLFTIATYSCFVALMWMMFESGADIFAQWLEKENYGFTDTDGLIIMRITGRIILIASACFFVIRPYQQKN